MGRTKKLPWRREYSTIVDEGTRAEGKVRMGGEVRKEIGMDRESWTELIWGLRFCRARPKGG
jgi:hypothetical protein